MDKLKYLIFLKYSWKYLAVEPFITDCDQKCGFKVKSIYKILPAERIKCYKNVKFYLINFKLWLSDKVEV